MLFLDIASCQMYVPGTLNDVEHVLVDVGTGYYVEKVKTFAFWKTMIIDFHWFAKCKTGNCCEFYYYFCICLSVECGRLEGILQAQNWLPHEADRENSASPSGKTWHETR